jgi:hypothetical protein
MSRVQTSFTVIIQMPPQKNNIEVPVTYHKCDWHVLE